MRLGRRLCPACLPVLAAVASLAAQTTPVQPLTTVSLKRNVSGSPNSNMEVRPGGRLFATNVTLRNMLRNIHRLQEYQLVGGPSWVATDRWDIVAVVEAEVTETQAVPLLKAFLIERFKLKMHTETREVPVYSLELARPDGAPGPELRRSTVECAVAGNCGDGGGPGVLRVVGRPIPNVLRRFEQASGRMVIDRTGLTDAYDFTLRWRPDDAPDVNPDQPSFFTAVQEQLGLRLRPDRAPVEVLVIDSAELPAVD